MSFSDTICNLKFQVYITESCGDRNQSERTEKMIKNSPDISEDTAVVSDIMKAVILLIYNTDVIYIYMMIYI